MTLRGQLRTALRAAVEPPPSGHPWCAGAVVLAGAAGGDEVCETAGWAVRYAAYDPVRDEGVELPRDAWLPVRADTVFDLASLTKLCTAILTVQAAERGELDLDAPVAAALPEFGAAGKHELAPRQLLTHTSGLRAELPFYDHPTGSARLEPLWAEEPLTRPGTAYRYSDLDFITLGLLLERVTGTPLDTLLRDRVTGPLAMADTRFRPPASWLPRTAATEDQRRPWAKADRGMLHGTAHDENAHALGGVAGHAGLFSTAADLGLLCRALLDGGAGILQPRTVRQLTADHGLPGRPHGLGFELDQPWYMGELSGPGTAGHTGFTGTSLVLDPATGHYVVLLANAVHPCRTWRRGNAVRAAVATALARHRPRRPA
ncbi:MULTISPECIES: serine hydrolase domain-containing protein [Streptomycetaceae]|uniref:Beta-lactamase n=1 Tax=Streptantibioticus cattleyicolor (strain ATCC 35852 / DSM 46488 / JCM 4925 / NBRC 14057 / NRRL 8057) TaxID=1003195 RepID=F8K238_STREN